MKKLLFALLTISISLIYAAPTEFRHAENKLRYHKLSYKGLRFDQIRNHTLVKPKFDKPQFKTLNVNIAPGKMFSARVELLNESNVSRNAPVRFGLPVAKGVLKSTAFMQVISPEGKAVPAQFSAVGFWQDKSIKHLLVSFTAPLKPNEKCFYQVKTVPRMVQAANAVKYTTRNGIVSVDTGVLRADINLNDFKFLQNIKVNGKAAGSFGALELRDEHGKLFSGSKVTMNVEENGAHHLTLRFDGSYGKGNNTLCSFNVRITFYKQSALTAIQVRHLNSNLKQEFTDLDSLSFSFTPAAKAAKLNDGKKDFTKIFQHNDRKLEVNSTISNLRMADGASAFSANGTKLFSFALRNAALRYPKSFAVNNGKIEIALLPKLPDAKFGTELPHYLLYNLCEGKHRSKWGMCFTEDMWFDFSPDSSAAALNALDTVAVVDRKYLTSTGALEGTAGAEKFALWDKTLIEGFYNFMKVKDQKREYGYFNYGDSYGERIYNWTNNEYDIANGLFGLFYRTGNRDVYRYACAAARHQADVDTINFYPALGFTGANCQHCLGHTGARYGVRLPGLAYSTWSFPADYNGGDNGHHWIRGMLKSWVTSGDTVAMESAIKTATHMKRTSVRSMGLSERGAGWMMVALCAFYDITADESYLKKAQAWAKMAMGEQKFDVNGAWPHMLPGDHAGNFKGAKGNCLFFIGVLTAGLRAVHQSSPTPELARSISASTTYQDRCFDRGGAGWPYTASVDANPYFRTSLGCNMIIAPGYIRGGRLLKNKQFYRNTLRMVAAALASGASNTGKEFAMDLVFTSEVMDELIAFSAENNIELPILTKEKLLPFLASQAGGFFSRGPREKEFKFELAADGAAEFTMTRVPYGARPKIDKEYLCEVVAPDGKIIFKRSGSTDVGDNFTVKVNGKAKDCFTIKLTDDMRSIWQATGKGGEMSTKILPGYHNGSGEIIVRQLIIPPGEHQVTLGVLDGNILETYVFDTAGNTVASRKRSGSLNFKVKNTGKTNAYDPLLVIGNRNLRGVTFSITGIPPYLASH